MKLIPLEEIEKIWRLKHTPELMVVDKEGQYISLNNIYYIPTIDPIQIIDEMIMEKEKEWKGTPKWEDSYKYKNGYIIGLQEFKQKLSPK